MSESEYYKDFVQHRSQPTQVKGQSDDLKHERKLTFGRNSKELFVKNENEVQSPFQLSMKNLVKFNKQVTQREEMGCSTCALCNKEGVLDTLLPCGHNLHLECVQNYMLKLKEQQMDPCCPNCKATFSPLKQHLEKMVNPSNNKLYGKPLVNFNNYNREKVIYRTDDKPKNSAQTLTPQPSMVNSVSAFNLDQISNQELRQVDQDTQNEIWQNQYIAKLMKQQESNKKAIIQLMKEPIKKGQNKQMKQPILKPQDQQMEHPIKKAQDQKLREYRVKYSQSPSTEDSYSAYSKMGLRNQSPVKVYKSNRKESLKPIHNAEDEANISTNLKHNPTAQAISEPVSQPTAKERELEMLLGQKDKEMEKMSQEIKKMKDNNERLVQQVKQEQASNKYYL